METFLSAVRLRDGKTVAIRPIRPDDAERLQHFHRHLSPDTIRFRYFVFRPELSLEEARRLCDLDGRLRMAFVATVLETDGQSTSKEIIGVARYDATEPAKPGDSEFAIVLRDDYQGRGLGKELLLRLAEYARAHGLRTMSGTLLSGNLRMLRFLQSSGYPLELEYKGSDELEFSLDLVGSPA